MINNISVRNTTFWVIIASLVAWTLGAAFFAPAASAALADGDIVKIDGSAAVYIIKGDQRFVYPSFGVYQSWHGDDFSLVKTVTSSELASFSIGGNVTVRPGTKLVQFVTNETPFQVDDPKVYAITPGGMTSWVETAEVAAALYGADWETRISPQVNTLAANYDSGTSLSSATFPSGSVVDDGGTKYFVDGSSKRLITDSGFSANGFDNMYVLSGDLSGLSAGSNLDSREDSIASPVGAGGVTSSTGSSLTISLAASNPVGATLPKGATQVGVLDFNVSAPSDGAVTIGALSIKRIGAGDETDFNNVYIFDGAERLTTGRSVNSASQSASFNNLNFSVPAGATKTLSVRADVVASPTVGDVHTFEIKDASAITAGGATVVGSFPVRGNEFTIGGVTNGAVTVSKNGSVTNPKVGEKGIKVAEFKVDASGSNEDIEFQSISLFQAGSVSRGDLVNFELRQAGVVVATAANITNDDLVVLDLGSNAINIDKGQSKVLELYADISGSAKSGSGETIKFYLDEDTDILAVGQDFGFGATVTRTTYDGGSCTSTSGDCSYSTIDAGQITITTSGPAARDISRNADDVVLMEFTIASQIEAEFRQFIVRFDGGGATDTDTDLVSGTTALVTDVKVIRKSDGVVVIGPNDLSGTGSDDQQSVTSTERFIQNEGTSDVYQITADLSSSMTNNSQLRVAIKAFGSTDIKNIENNTFLATSDIVPSSDLFGNTMTVLSPTLELALSSSPVSDTFIKGSNDVTVAGFNFIAGDADDVDLTNLVLTGYIDENAGTTFATGTDNSVDVQDIFTSVWLIDDAGVQVGDRETFASGSTGTATFSNFTWTVPAGQTRTLFAHVDISNNAYQNSNDETMVVDIDAAADVTARDSDGNSITATGSSPNDSDSANVVATVTNAGTISVAAGPIDSSVESQNLIMGTSLQPLANFRFSAANEELELTQIQFRIPTTSTDEVTKLYIFDGATQIGSGVQVNGSTGKAKFNLASGSGFSIPQDGNNTLTVKGDLATSSNGADSAATSTVTFDYNNSFEARGVGSSDTLLTSAGSADVAGQNMFVYKTLPTVSSVALGSTTLNNGGENEIYSFKVSADSSEDIALKLIELDVNSSSTGTGSIGTFKLFRGSNDITSQVSFRAASTWNVSLESGGSNLGSGATTAYIVFDTEELITAGSSTTFTVRATVTGYTASNDFISVQIADDSAVDAGHKYVCDTNGSGSTNLAALCDASDNVQEVHSFIWSDNSSTSHSSTLDSSSSDWFNGTLVDNLTTVRLTIEVP